MKNTVRKLLMAILGAIATLGILATFVGCIVLVGEMCVLYPYIAIPALAITIFVCLVVYFMIVQGDD